MGNLKVLWSKYQFAIYEHGLKFKTPCWWLWTIIHIIKKILWKLYW